MIVDGNNFIRHYLKNNKPLAAGKIGANELSLLYMYENKGVIQGRFKKDIEDGTGLVPASPNMVEWFYGKYTEALSTMDLMCAWSQQIPQFELDLIKKNPKVNITLLQHLEPYFFESPWTDSLQDKKVLVLTPFADSFNKNYKKFDKIWNGKIKPNFDLKAINYPTSITITENSKFNNSRDIYNEYIDILNKENFDVGIFGTGFTGLMFAAECKKLGKAGIHLGGATQILFGVYGNRWKDHEQFKSFINEHWTRPQTHETPIMASNVEAGCYW